MHFAIFCRIYYHTLYCKPAFLNFFGLVPCRCWLNPYTHFVWAFIAPVLVVICVNVGFFIMTLIIMHRHAKTRSTTSEARQVVKDHCSLSNCRIVFNTCRYWLRSSVSLVTIMGLTWAVGILVFEVPVLYPLAYIFTIFVAFQGVAIFVLFVLLNKPVREAYSKWWKIKATKSEIYSRLFPNQSLTKVISNSIIPKPIVNQLQAQTVMSICHMQKSSSKLLPFSVSSKQ